MIVQTRWENPVLEFFVSFSLKEETHVGLHNDLFIMDEILKFCEIL